MKYTISEIWHFAVCSRWQRARWTMSRGSTTDISSWGELRYHIIFTNAIFYRTYAQLFVALQVWRITEHSKCERSVFRSLASRAILYAAAFHAIVFRLVSISHSLRSFVILIDTPTGRWWSQKFLNARRS